MVFFEDQDFASVSNLHPVHKTYLQLEVIAPMSKTLPFPIKCHLSLCQKQDGTFRWWRWLPKHDCILNNAFKHYFSYIRIIYTLLFSKKGFGSDRLPSTIVSSTLTLRLGVALM